MRMNYWKHFKKIWTHKYYVFCECWEYGLVWQGLTHDLSKFRPSEFRLARFYAGLESPINVEKRQSGYSLSWVQHTNRNKHHWEYWVDRSDGKLLPIPEKYVKEMVCDTIAASRAYNGKNWRPEMVLDYMDNRSSWPQSVKDLTRPLILAKIQKYYHKEK